MGELHVLITLLWLMLKTVSRHYYILQVYFLLVHFCFFEKVNKYSKKYWFMKFFLENFFGKRKKRLIFHFINFFYIFYKNSIKTFYK